MKQQLTVDILLSKLITFFNAPTLVQLAQELGVSQQTISAWKARNSVSAIEKKCRELGIYTAIFTTNQEIQDLFNEALATAPEERIKVLKDYLIQFINENQITDQIKHKIKTLKEQDFWNIIIGTGENLFELLIQVLDESRTLDKIEDSREQLKKLIQDTKTGLQALNPRVFTFESDKLKLLAFVDTLDDIECMVILKNAPEIIKIIKQNRTWMNRLY